MVGIITPHRSVFHPTVLAANPFFSDPNAAVFLLNLMHPPYARDGAAHISRSIVRSRSDSLPMELEQKLI